MFTTCPNCALNLAVTAADLRVGQGYVRCGRCVSVFNALISLADEAEVGPDEAQVEDRASATQSRPVPEGAVDLSELALEEPGGVAEAEAALEAEVAAGHVTEPPPPARPEPEALAETVDVETSGETAAALPQILEESRDEATGTVETIVLEGDTILQTEEFVDEAEVDEQLKALAEQMQGDEPGAGREAASSAADRAVAADSAAPRLAPPFVGEPAVDAYAGPATADHADAGLDGLIAAPRARRPVPRLLWVSIALALLLALQVLHHWRQPLAARLPFVASVYAGIGAPLAPQWQLGAYEVRQLGAAADPADARRIEVRASIRNGATRAQPAPLLRIVLQDRFGNEIGRHERGPDDYLRGASAPLLAPDQRMDASLWIEDPQEKAVGFELDACLRAPGGALRCASDPPPR